MRPYILLTVDSLRADSVTPSLMGNSLEILNDDFATFTNAISYGVATPFAFPGIIAGTHPTGDGMIPESATTLAEGIPGRSVAFTNNGHLNAQRGYARGFDEFVEAPSLESETGVLDRTVEFLKQFGTIRNSRLAERIYDKTLQDSLPIPYLPAEGMVELAQSQLSDSPGGLLWAHWMDPHTPYHPETAVISPANYPSLSKLADINERLIQGNANALSEEEIRLVHELYEANVRYYDRHFSTLLEWLREQPWYEDALIIIVSDHGDYFGEHDLLFHPWDTDPYDEVVKTPLWVKYPDQEDGGESYDHLVGHGDILATIAMDKNVSLPTLTHTAPLRDVEGRTIVSVSNTVKRLTETGGVVFERRDGSTSEHGNISSEGRKVLQEVAYPECSNMEGEALGIEEAERQRRLSNLGYK